MRARTTHKHTLSVKHSTHNTQDLTNSACLNQLSIKSAPLEPPTQVPRAILRASRAPRAHIKHTANPSTQTSAHVRAYIIHSAHSSTPAHAQLAHTYAHMQHARTHTSSTHSTRMHTNTTAHHMRKHTRAHTRDQRTDSTRSGEQSALKTHTPAQAALVRPGHA